MARYKSKSGEWLAIATFPGGYFIQFCPPQRMVRASEPITRRWHRTSKSTLRHSTRDTNVEA